MRWLFFIIVLKTLRCVELCQPNKCTTNNCYLVPPSPLMYPPAPSTFIMSPTYAMPPSSIPLNPPLPPPPPPPPSQMQMNQHQPMMMNTQSMMMTATQSAFISPLEPPQISSSAVNSYEVSSSPEMTRWDRQEPEYKHIDQEEPIVAPDVLISDSVDEKSSNSEKVEKIHEDERLARMDLKFEEPEATPFDNGTVTFHAWFF